MDDTSGRTTSNTEGMPKMQQPILESTAAPKKLNRFWSQMPLENISGFLYLIYYRPTRHVKLGFSLDPASRRMGLGQPSIPRVRSKLPAYKTVVLAGMMPGKFVDELSFHKSHKKDASAPEWYSRDSNAVQELLTWDFNFPELFYSRCPQYSKFNWLLKKPAGIWFEQMRAVLAVRKPGRPVNQKAD